MLAGLTTTAPAAQASFIGTALALTLPAATGGSPGYTWSDPGGDPAAGPGRVDGQQSGRDHRHAHHPRGVPGDADRHRLDDHPESTVSFSWTTDYPPMVATNPGPQTSTVSTADSVTLSVTGGSGSFAWTGGATLPAGLTLSSAGVVSGTPTAAGVTSVALMVTDTKTAIAQNVAFSWTVYAPADGDLAGQPERDGRCGGVAAIGDDLPERAVQLRADQRPGDVRDQQQRSADRDRHQRRPDLQRRRPSPSPTVPRRRRPARASP